MKAIIEMTIILQYYNAHSHHKPQLNYLSSLHNLSVQ